jgi:tRNA-dihydrouridine synthase C
VINPFLFHQIRAHFSGRSHPVEWKDLASYLEVYLAEIPLEASARLKINKLKQLMGFLFKGNTELLNRRQNMLTTVYSDLESFLSFTIPFLKEGWLST